VEGLQWVGSASREGDRADGGATHARVSGTLRPHRLSFLSLGPV